jgi:branched-chain amino acid transport system substrate-binding protein
MRLSKIVAAAAIALASSAAFSQTIKIGFITSYSGLNGNLGPYMERAVRLYMKQHEKELPPGVKIELLTRDDTGPNPDKAKQLAQELIVRDKVDLLAGVIFTPNALAIAPLCTEAKVPFVIMNAGTSVITTRSPYIIRASFTLWQASYPLGQWAAKKFKTAYTLVSDFGPGHDSEEAFIKGFTPKAAARCSAACACRCRTPTGRPTCSASRMRSPTSSRSSSRPARPPPR